MTVTDGPSVNGSRDMVIDLRARGIVTASGQLTPFVSELFVGTAQQWIFGSTPSQYPTCTFHLQSYALLEKNGFQVGKRVGLYLLTYSGNDGTLSGKVRFYDYDTSETITSVTNGTFAGTSIAADLTLYYQSPSTYYADPFWNQ